MLSHPDPVIQTLFNNICEQRDVAMVQAANCTVALKNAQDEIEALKAQLPVVLPPENLA